MARIRSTRSSSIRRIPMSRRGAGTSLRGQPHRQLAPQLTQPTIHQASIGYERPLGEWGNFRTDYMLTRGADTLRSINVNAPIVGVRPDPTAGNITEIGSTGKRPSDRITVGMLLRIPNRRIMGNVMYQYANSRNFADSPLSLPSNSNDPDARLGSVGAGHPPSPVPHGQHAAADGRARQHAGAVFVGAAVHHHDRPRRQRRHRVQRSARSASAATARAARRSGTSTSASIARSTSAACSATVRR